ncbi:MAG: CRISPR-associated endonuclease Cas3'' [candidate division WOR-3 bacterium]
MPVSLYSAPAESYQVHIEQALRLLDQIFPLYASTLARVLEVDDEKRIAPAMRQMVLYHDLGKLTSRWQKNIGTTRSLPAHAPFGAALLYRLLDGDLRNPLSFAVAIHHTDRGLLSDNIERADVQAILDKVVNDAGRIVWADGVAELGNDYFPELAFNLSIEDLKTVTRGMRIWARGCSLEEQHRRRLQAALAHHVLKLCDVAAAAGRREEYKQSEDSAHYGGWFMVDEILNYVNAIKARNRQ